MMQVDRSHQLHHYIRQKEQEHHRKFVEYRSLYEHTGKTSHLLAQTEYQGAVTAYQDLLNVYEMQSMSEEQSAHQYMPEPGSPQLQDDGSVLPPNISQGFQTLREYCDRKYREIERQIGQCQERFTATGNEKYVFLQRKYTGAVMAYDEVIQFLETLASADEECASSLHPRTETHHNETMQPVPPVPQKSSHSFVHILALEASSMVRKMLEMLLISEGFTVTTASDGVVGLEIARKISPDLILMDNSIAWRNEEQLLFLLRRDKRLRRIPIILLTSSLKGFDERLKKHAGVMVSIQKPFQPEELLNAIQEVLAQ